VQSVVYEEYGLGFGRRPPETGELARFGKRLRTVRGLGDEGAVGDAVGRDLGVRSGRQGSVLIQELAPACDDGGSADRVVAAGVLASVRVVDDVRAVQRIVERAPAGVGGVAANRAFSRGTTSCGPETVAISGSTRPVSMAKSPGSSTRYPIERRNSSYASGSAAAAPWARWYSSICCCVRSRISSSSCTRGENFSMSPAAPAQNASVSIPVPGRASSRTKA